MNNRFNLIVIVSIFSTKILAGPVCIPQPQLLLPGVTEAEIVANEAIWATAVSHAHYLATTCSPVPLEPKTCPVIFASYTAEVTELTKECPPLEITENPAYLIIPFTPCKYSASAVIVPDLCPGA